MDSCPDEDLLARARCGVAAAREQFLAEHKPYIQRVASAYCKRSLAWENDDELSVALIAFNEAIDSYRPGQGAQFLPFAAIVIRRRLVDYFRQESRHRHLALDDPAGEAELGVAEVLASAAAFRQRSEDEERELEIIQYEETLRAYGLTLEDLVLGSPKHRDTRQTLKEAARVLATTPELAAHLKKHRQVPLKEMVVRTGISRKILETGRKYIVALALLLMDDSLTLLRSHVTFGKGGDGA